MTFEEFKEDVEKQGLELVINHGISNIYKDGIHVAQVFNHRELEWDFYDPFYKLDLDERRRLFRSIKSFLATGIDKRFPMAVLEKL